MPMCFAGSSIHACRNVNRHIVALEADSAIFNALLAPLIHTAPQNTKAHHDSMADVIDLASEDVVVERIVKKSRFSK